MEPSQPDLIIQIIAIQAGQPIKPDRILFSDCTYLGILQKKINMVAVNMSKFKLINDLYKLLVY